MIAQYARLSRKFHPKALRPSALPPMVAASGQTPHPGMNISGNTRVFLILGDPDEPVRAPEMAPTPVRWTS